MEGRKATSVRPRVVVLSRDAVLASRLVEACAPAAAVAAVACGFEAAAEVLAAPVAVLVIDFRCLPPAHERLLDLARELEVEVLGVGATPTGIAIDRLSGVRLVSRDDLAVFVVRSLDIAASPAEPEARELPTPIELPENEPEAWPEAEAEVEAVAESAPPVAGAPASEAPRGNGRRGPAAPRPAWPEADDQPELRAPSQLLSPEELSALLEDDA